MITKANLALKETEQSEMPLLYNLGKQRPIDQFSELNKWQNYYIYN